MRGLPKGAVKAVVPGMSPRLDILVNGSTEVNRCRAQQSGSVAVATQAAPAAAPEVKVLERDRIQALVKDRPKDKTPPDVHFSLFVQLNRDLEPKRRAEAVKELQRVARRVRWKGNTAVVEANGGAIQELLALHRAGSVSYIELGETLRGPEPSGGEDGGKPDRRLRQVAAQAKRHGYGRDVLVGIIDVGGFDFAHEDFRTDEGGTRWVGIWDQGGTVRQPPAVTRKGDTRFSQLSYGGEIVKANMDAAITVAEERKMAATSLEPQSAMVAGSHGTHVASIAAGNRGVARQADLAGVLVALRPEDSKVASSFYDSTRIADAVDYLLALAAKLGDERGLGQPLPVSINISLGTNGHAHDTSSAMARWIDSALTAPGRCVTVAAGNAGQVEPESADDRALVMGRIHAGGRFAATGLRHELGWIVVGDDQVRDVSENELEIWYAPQDRFNVELKPPGGAWIGPVEPGQSIRNSVLDNGTVLSIHSETYYPANGANRISIVLSPFFDTVDNQSLFQGPIAPGQWQVRLTGVVVRDGRYDAWIERDDPRRTAGPGGRNWRYPSYFAPGSYTDDRMISSLACAERILAVANVDVGRNAAHVTSSRGPTRDGRFKPDIGADGTDVIAAAGFDRRRSWMEMTGTSMASPYVCGVAALMLAIAPRLTSAQILGIVRSTSAPLPGHDFEWRKDTGFGVIDAEACVEEAAVYAQRLRSPA
jgi:subtilisin family serine protease